MRMSQLHCQKQVKVACHHPLAAVLIRSQSERADTVADSSNEFETVIGVDTNSDQPEVQLFTTMQTKLQLLSQEAAKIARASPAQLEVPTSVVAAEEQCKRIVFDLQDIAKKLSKRDASKLDAIAAGKPHPQLEALAVPSGAPMSTFHAATLPAAYVEFHFGDCCPFLSRPKPVACKQIFGALPWREELEYTLASDTEPYRAPKRSRFDDPEFVALFARGRSFPPQFTQ